MSILVNITQAEIRNAEKELDGKVLTRPKQLLTDGVSLIYVVDVEIGQGSILRNVPIARANREMVYAEVNAAVRLRRSESGGYEIIGFSKQLPGTYIRVPVTLPVFSFGDAGVITGTPPQLSPPGQVIIGTPIDKTKTGRALTYEELSTLGTYGSTPYGAVGIFIGGVLQEIKA